MAELWASPVVSVVLLVALAGVLIAVGVYVVGRVRAGLHNTDPQASEWLTKFKDLHSRGELTDQEYRTIKAMLADRLQRELNGTDEPR